MRSRCSRGFLAVLVLGLVFCVSELVLAQNLTFSINDVTTTDGNGGSNIATFKITRSGTGSIGSVQYSTSNGTATGGGSGCSAGEDFLNLSSGVSFSSSETEKDITITTCGDTLDENDETFNVTLSSPSGGTIADGTGVATIVDDDPLPSIRINDVTVVEGNAGATNAAFTARLNTESGRVVTVVFATANDTATGGAACAGNTDFVNNNNTVTFAAGVTTQPINISVCGDTAIENNERLRLNLSTPSNATIADNSGFGTITTDDTPNLTIADASETEPITTGLSKKVRFAFHLSNVNPNGAKVHFQTFPGTALQGKLCGTVDYTVKIGTLEFGPTEQDKNVDVPICHDTEDEPNQTFTMQLTNGQGLVITDASATGTIIDND